ncbi:hypothetical protein [Ramlibacter tataouinensis]|uniref:DUF2783 domain-containing protein n=1 Tax=Ramlibacter tataouinensis (strain ATCC BAA-407 / DSM 14655 / LMG 21543 / TTB310) TaxID=365046 RepID=F5XYH9_RAMTT|nr:hypothetical protein [Ramlibacter tataouinensis]AEG93155.1 hypothetical protein Rta_20620 [Ramlibacter tataouinensis TTB310]
MTDADLDRSYAAVREALAEVGPDKAQLFLSMLCLALMARHPSAEMVLPLVENVRAQCAAE